MLDIKHIRAFRQVAEELHFGRAAKLLHIAQPPLSRQIQEFERSLGVRLFERGPRYVRLTAAGATLYARTGTVLADLESALHDATRAGRGMVGRLSLAFIHSSGYMMLPEVLRTYRRQCPEVDIELQEMTILEQTEALRRGRIDVGILRPPVVVPGVESEELLVDPFMLVVPDNHRLASRAKASLREVRDDPFILFPRTTSPLFYSRILSMCEEAGFSPKLAQQAMHIHTVLGLVHADLGIAIVPATGRTLTMPGIRWLEIAEAPPPVAVSLAWRRESDTALVAGFRTAAHSAIAALPQPA